VVFSKIMPGLEQISPWQIILEFVFKKPADKPIHITN